MFCVKRVVDGIEVNVVEVWVLEEYAGERRGVWRARPGDINREPILQCFPQRNREF